MSRQVEYKFDIDEVVIVTHTGEKGVVSMLGFDDGGVQYFVKLKDNNQWWKEKQLKKCAKK